MERRQQPQDQKYTLVGIHYQLPELGSRSIALKVKIVYFRDPNDKQKRAAIVAEIDTTNRVKDKSGIFHTYHAPPANLRYPQGSIGLLKKPTKNLPRQEQYLAKIQKIKNSPRYDCTLTPLDTQINSNPRKNYVTLLEMISEEYRLGGLPPHRDTLFGEYIIPDGVTVPTPGNVFTSYPQRPKPGQHDFSKSVPLLPPTCKQEGRTIVLFNQDFTLCVGRALDSNSKYGYGLMLLRNDPLRIYTMEHTVHNCIYGKDNRIIWRDDPRDLLADLQELVVLAFYRPQYRSELIKYRKKHAGIAWYLDEGYIIHWFKVKTKTEKFQPITCLYSGESKFVNWPCEGYATLEQNVNLFREFATSGKKRISKDQEIRGGIGIQISVNRGRDQEHVTFYRTGSRPLIQPGRDGALHKEIQLWCDENLDVINGDD